MKKLPCWCIFLLLSGLAGGVVWAAPVHWTGPGANGHWFEAIYVPGGITWSAARAAVAARGGYLATATSAAENTFIAGLVSDPQFWQLSYENSAGPWLGGYQAEPRVEPAGNWKWVSGDTWSFTRWASGQPNNSGGIENCLHFFTNTNPGVLTPGETWNDNDDFEVQKGYVIEWPRSSSGMSLLLLD